MAKAKKQSAKTARKTSRVRKIAVKTVDYYPNRMTLAVSVLAGTLLVLLAIIAVLGSNGWR